MPNRDRLYPPNPEPAQGSPASRVGEHFTAKVGDHPAIDELMGRVVRHLRRHVPHACRHLGTRRPAFLCAHHPASGILCAGCFAAHAERHSFDVEHRCDGCGASNERQGLMVFWAPLSGWTPTRNPTRGMGIAIGSITVACMALCPACFDQPARAA